MLHHRQDVSDSTKSSQIFDRDLFDPCRRTDAALKFFRRCQSHSSSLDRISSLDYSLLGDTPFRCRTRGVICLSLRPRIHAYTWYEHAHVLEDPHQTSPDRTQSTWVGGPQVRSCSYRRFRDRSPILLCVERTSSEPAPEDTSSIHVDAQTSNDKRLGIEQPNAE